MESYAGQVVVLGGVIPGPYICVEHCLNGHMKLVSTVGGLISAQIVPVKNVAVNSYYEDHMAIAVVIDSITSVLTNNQIKFTTQGRYEALQTRRALVRTMRESSKKIRARKRIADDQNLEASRIAEDEKELAFFKELLKDPQPPV